MTSTSSVFVDQQAAVATEYPATVSRSGKQRRLGEGLGLERGAAERRGTDQARPAGFAGRRVDQVVGRAAVVLSPGPGVDAGGRDAARAEPETVGPASAHRVLDLDLVRVGDGVGATDPDVSAAADQETGVAGQRLGDQVGGQPFAGTAGIESESGRPADHSEAIVDRERLPAPGSALGRAACLAGAAARDSVTGRPDRPARELAVTRRP